MSSLDIRGNSAVMKRAEQLKRWEEWDTVPCTPRSERGRKIKFSSGCVFLAACQSSDKEEVLNLLENGADINTANVDGLTALHQACIDDNMEMVEFLVEQGADINRQDNEGWTPLHATVSCGFVSIARYLVESGADVAAVNSDGDLAIDLAAHMQKMSMMDYMQKVVAEHNIDCEKARQAEEELMLSDAKRWLRSDASEADRPHPKTGATALHVAAAKGYTKVLSLLLAGRANVDRQDNDGWTPLHAAAHWSQKQAAEMLVDAMADMDVRNFAGQTCIDVADRKMVKFLEELRANNKRIKRRPSAQIRISDAIENQFEKTPTKIIRVELKPEQPAKEQANDENKSRYMTDTLKQQTDPQPASAAASTDEEAPWRRNTIQTRARTQNESSTIKNQVPEKEIISKKTNTNPTTTPTETSDVILRRTQSFENDEKFYQKYHELRARIKANSCPILPASQIGIKNNNKIINNNYNNNNNINSINTSNSLTNNASTTTNKPITSNTNTTNISTTNSTTANQTNNQTTANILQNYSVQRSASLKDHSNFRKPTTAATTAAATTTTTTSTTINTTPTATPIRRSFVPPARDEESETQRKAHAKRVRETRRSTQGVTLDEIKSAEELIKKKNSSMNNNNNNNSSSNEAQTSTTATTTITPPTSPQQQQSTPPIASARTSLAAAAVAQKASSEKDEQHVKVASNAEDGDEDDDDATATFTIIAPPLRHTRTTMQQAANDNDDKVEHEDDDSSEVSASYTFSTSRPESRTPTPTPTPTTETVETTIVVTPHEIQKSGDEEHIENEKTKLCETINDINESSNKKTDYATPIQATETTAIQQPEPIKAVLKEEQKSDDELRKRTAALIPLPLKPAADLSSTTTTTTPTIDSPVRLRDKRSLFDIDNASSLSLAEKLRNEANKYSSVAAIIGNNDIPKRCISVAEISTAASPYNSIISTTNTTAGGGSDSSESRDSVFGSYASRRSLDSSSLPSSPMHHRDTIGIGSGHFGNSKTNATNNTYPAERRPSWRLKFDAGSKFKLEDASSVATYPPNNSTIIPSAPAVIAAANLSSTVSQRRINSAGNAINASNQSLNSIGRPVSAPSAGNTNDINSHERVTATNSIGSYGLRRLNAASGLNAATTASVSTANNANNSATTTTTTSTASTANNATTTNSNDEKDNDKENDNRSALATQSVIQRRRKPKRRSTGVVHLDMDDLDPERQDSNNDNEEKESGSERVSRSRLGSTSSITAAKDDNKSRDRSENGEIDYKALWEAAKLENDKLKQQLKKKDDEVVQTRATLERFTNATTKNSLSEIEKRERRAMERKLSEMEEELKQLDVYKTENQRLKEENGALIRVISKLSK